MVMVKEHERRADAVGTYLDAIRHYPLLTRQDEMRLGRRVAAGQEAATELAEGGTGPRAARRRELERAVAGGEQAVREIIEANLRLVVSVAKRYRRSPMPLLDLIQEGNLGLIQAARRYDYRRGFKFSTAATGWISQAITLAIATKGRIIRLPVAMDRNLGLVRQARLNLPATEPREAMRRLTAETGLTQAQVTQAEGHIRDVASLSDPLPGEGHLLYSDVVADPWSMSPFAEVEATLVARAVRDLLSGLDEREREVVRLRFGINEQRGHTLEEVAQRFQVSRERIRQIENQALERLLYRARRADLGLDALHD